MNSVHKMRLIAIDRVACIVCLLVAFVSSVKTTDPSRFEMPFGGDSTNQDSSRKEALKSTGVSAAEHYPAKNNGDRDWSTSHYIVPS